LKAVGLLIVGMFGGLLIYGSLDFPAWGDPQAPASLHVSPYYIKQSLHDTSVPNIVTAVLADYRAYDTMFETIVIFTSGIACMLLLRVSKPVERKYRRFRHMPTGITLRFAKGSRYPEDSDDFEPMDSKWVPPDLIIKTTCRIIIPFIQIFALYVIAHGHYSPGGGFQGGVIFGASFILYAIGFDLRTAVRRVGERSVAVFCALGVFIYAGTGLLCLLFGGNFLDYGSLSMLFGIDPVGARSHGILMVEIGVGISVMAVMAALYLNLASEGKMDEGL
jgi:multicomponent Na+:H+ antiporter subunit B